MRIALFSPFSSGPLRGNMITVQRIAQHLPATGWETMTVALDTTDMSQAKQLVDRYQPDLLHAFHAFHSGPTARRLAAHHQTPYLITMTGSDLHDPAFCRHTASAQALQDAAAIICFDSLAADLLTTLYPHLVAQTHIIPQGVTPLATRHPFSRPEPSFIILLPAALRPVKGILEAFDALAPLAQQAPQLRLWVAGGDLDPQYATRIRQQAATLPWVTLLGEVPHERMGDLFAACDLVLNHSHFEGGMANTLLEAMAAGKPVIASDVIGNRSLIRQSETGWLFKDHHELYELTERLMRDQLLLKTTGKNAKQMVLTQLSAQHEATRLAELYHQVLAAHRT